MKAQNASTQDRIKLYLKIMYACSHMENIRPISLRSIDITTGLLYGMSHMGIKTKNMENAADKK